ncbi:MAG: TlpA family protein disulfide reductase [Acidimicrobiia bacterium]|nr:TlpA family protein disulfide reductase [Acidimicrobiia bacterium]
MKHAINTARIFLMIGNRALAFAGLVAVASITVRCGPAQPVNAPVSSIVDGGDITKDAGERVTVELLKEPTRIDPFTLTDLDGKGLSSTDWKGKMVLVNFWATWCGPCRAEIPDLVALQTKYRDRLIVIGISEDEGPIDKVREFASQYKVNYPIVMTTPEIEDRFPGVAALPTTFFLDTEGRIAQRHIGILHARETEATARVLAGLEANADVKRIDDPSRMNDDDVSQIKDIPGVDLSQVPEGKRGEVLNALNSESCTCGCGLSVAKCRIDDPSCTISPPLAKTIVERVLAAK